MNRSLSSLLSLTNETIAVCPISGIPYAISFPSLGIDFSYKSPFASYKNLKKVCELESVSLKKLPKVTLAGITLAIMKERDLVVENHIPSFQANTYFQLISSHSLTSAIKFFYSIAENKIDLLPRFSLSSISFEVEHSTTTNILENYIKDCNNILHPPVETTCTIVDIDIPSLHSKDGTKTKVKSLSIEDKKAIKSLVAEVSADQLCTVKFITILHYLMNGNTIISLDNTLRTKIIDKLTIFSSPSAEKLILLLKKYNSVLEDDYMDRVSDDFAIVKAKKTLAEILAERIANK